MAANFAYVNGAQYNYNSSSTSIPISALNVTSGNLLVVGLRWEGGGATDTATATLADTAGNTYTAIDHQSTGSGEGHRSALFYCLDAIGHASNAITATISASRTYRQAYVAQYSYDGEIALGDTGNGVSGSDTTTVTSSPALAAAAGDLVIGWNSQYNSAYTFTPDGEYTARDTLGLAAFFDALPSGAFSDAPGGTYSSTGDSYVILTAVFETVEVPTGSTIVPTTGALATVAQAPALAAERRVEPGIGTVAVSGLAPTLTGEAASTYVAPGPGLVAVAPVAPALTTERRVTAGAGAALVTGLGPTLRTELTVATLPGAVTVAGLVPTLVLVREVAPATSAINALGHPPALTTERVVTPQAGSATAQGLGASLATERLITPATGALATQGRAPVIGLPGEATATPGVVAVTVQGHTPALATERVITPETAALALQARGPELVTTGAETIRGHVESGRRWRTRDYGPAYDETSAGPQPLLETDPTPPAPLPPAPALVLAEIPRDAEIVDVAERVARLEARRARQRRQQQQIIAFLARVA